MVIIKFSKKDYPGYVHWLMTCQSPCSAKSLKIRLHQPTSDVVLATSIFYTRYEEPFMDRGGGSHLPELVGGRGESEDRLILKVKSQHRVRH